MDQIYISWIARGILILIFLFLLYLFLRKKKKYRFQGVEAATLRFYRMFRTTPAVVTTPVKSKKRVNKTEELCRDIIEKIYRMKFPSVRPDFLKSPMTKKNLELDCYNDKLRVALEYNGKQHYAYTPHFHHTKKKFYAQVHRDDWKRKKCKEMGIKLIEIPYWIRPEKLEEYIRKELQKCGAL
jgi:hypothetical protein